MEKNQQMGPQPVTVPEQKYNSCWGCMFFDHHMVKSGMDPIYSNTCTHADVPKEHKLSGSFFRGNLGEGKQTPEWCPVLNPPAKPFTTDDVFAFINPALHELENGRAIQPGSKEHILLKDLHSKCD